MSLLGLTHTRLRINPLAGSAAILCTGGPDVIRKEAWPFYTTISGVRLNIGCSKNLEDLNPDHLRRMCASSCLSFRTRWGVCLVRLPRRCVCLPGVRQCSRRSSSWKTGGMVLGQTTAIVRWWLVEASKRAFRIWDARLTLALWRATAARATGPGVRVVKNRGSRRNGAALSPEMGVFACPSPFFTNV